MTSAILFVDVIPHPKRGRSSDYFNLDFLRIIRDNGWLSKIYINEKKDITPDSIEPKITTSEDLYKMYKNNINVSMFVFDDKVYVVEYKSGE